MNEQQTSVEFNDVRKMYYIQQRATPRLGAWLIDKVFEHLRRTPFWSLDGVSFSVPKGEMLGFLGKNGAGKSTTLKLAAGITQPTNGTVRTRGRVCSMLELGVGFHPDLSGMENIFYNGIILGLTRSEILERLEKIVSFSGLEHHFLMEPVKHYSSGMYARLACSVSMHLDPEILLIDEVFSVGDAGFQQKGITRILELHESGVTILIVSHILSAMRDLCDRLIWIHDGKVRADGQPEEITRDYRHFMIDQTLADDNFLKPDVTVQSELPDTRDTSRLISFRVTDLNGSEIDEVYSGDAIILEIDVDRNGNGTDFALEIAGRWPDGRVLFRDISEEIRSDLSGSDDEGTETIRYRIDYWPFLQTPVHLSAAIVSASIPGLILDRKLNWKIIQSRLHQELDIDHAVLSPKTVWTVKA